MHDFHGHFGGMHFIWWIIWIVLLIWIFLIPTDLPFRRSKNENPLDILKRRFAKGELSQQEYEESKRVLLEDNNIKKKDNE